MFAFGETLTLRTRTVTGRSPLGNDIYTETDTTSDGWVVYPRNSSELVQGQDTSIVGITAVYKGLVVLAAVDRVTVATGPYAGAYEVDGLPGYYSHPVTGTQVTELHLTRITG